MDEFNSGKNGLNNENGEIHVNEVQVDNINANEASATTESAVATDNAAAVEPAAASETASTVPGNAASVDVSATVEPAQVPVQQVPYVQAQQVMPSAVNGGGQAKTQSYYNENIKRTRNQKTGAGQLILVAVLGALIGAGLMFAATMFLSPVIQPAIDNLMGRTTLASDVAASGNNGIYKKVEITKSTTPVEAISEKVSPSIVGIKVTVQAQGQDFFFDLGGSGVGEGSGIIIRADGYILTNNHVVEGAVGQNSNKITEGSKIEVVLPNNVNKSYVATVVGRDAKTDIAVLKIDASNLPAAEMGDSDKVKSGELAVAIGNPGGMDYIGSVTAGIISGINRSIQMENGDVLKLIQTDAAINPGNSGGALVNSQGQVIGMNTVKIAATGYEGLGFAIPINEANSIAKSLIDFKYVKGRPYLGVSIDQRFNADIAKENNVPNGLLVYEVLPLTAAYKAGVQTGDIITKFDGKTVTVFQDLEDRKNSHKPGDKVKIEVYRNGKTLVLTATLDEQKNTD
jgi:serine protease Do